MNFFQDKGNKKNTFGNKNEQRVLSKRLFCPKNPSAQQDQQKTIEQQIIPIYKPILDFNLNYRYRVLLGGRGSGKTFQISLSLLDQARQRPLRILVIRKTQTSQSQSVLNEFLKHIQKYNFNFHYQSSKKQIQGYQSTIFFSGVYHSECIKGVSHVDVVWIEEADQLNYNDFLDLSLSIRSKQNNLFFLSANPPAQGTYHWIYQHFFKKAKACSHHWARFWPEQYQENKNQQALLLKTSYLDNPYLPQSYIHDLKNIPQGIHYGRFVLGQWENQENTRILSHAQIKSQEFFYQKLTLEKIHSLGHLYWGLDFGYEDSTTLVGCFYIQTKNSAPIIWVDQQYSWEKMLPDQLTQALKSIFEKQELHTIYADCSRPEWIAYLKNKGFPLKSCYKNAGSLLRGIDFLRFRQLWISQHCSQMVQEAHLYCFAKDSYTQKVDTTQPIDDHNHCVDALRYALEPYIFQRQGQGRGYETFW